MFLKDLIQVKQHERNLVQINNFLVNKQSIYRANVLYDYNDKCEDGFAKLFLKMFSNKQARIFYETKSIESADIVKLECGINNHNDNVSVLNDIQNNIFLRIDLSDSSEIYNWVDIADFNNITGMLASFENLDIIDNVLKLKKALSKLVTYFDIAHIQGNINKFVEIEHFKLPKNLTISFVKKEINFDKVSSVMYPLAIDKFSQNKPKFFIPS